MIAAGARRTRRGPGVGVGVRGLAVRALMHHEPLAKRHCAMIAKALFLRQIPNRIGAQILVITARG
jgi:hypothetical protein